jgi:hypothetical protein
VDNSKVQPKGSVSVWSDEDLARLAEVDEAALVEAIEDLRRRFPELAALLETQAYEGEDDGQSA